MDFVRHATEPAPAVLKELQTIRRLLETLTDSQPHLEEILNTRLPAADTWATLTTGQRHLEEILNARLPVTGMWEQLAARLPASRRRARPDKGGATTDQLVLPTSRALEVTERDTITEAQSDEQTPPASIFAAGQPESSPVTGITVTDTDSVASTDVQERDTEPTQGIPSSTDVSWQEQFARIEQAWLADRPVGDLHEGKHFREIAVRVRRDQPDLRDNDVFLRKLDVVRQRYGDGFSYCLLDGALRQLHRPILNPLLLTAKMRQLQGQRRRWHT
jgi:hypothetical protein